jgi:hypothetical protein
MPRCRIIDLPMQARLLLLLAMALPSAAFAQGFGPIRWDYVAGNFIASELDDIGIELEGSTAVTRNLVVFGAYRDYEPGGNVDRETLQIGVGHRWNVRPNLDLMVSLSYADNEIDRRMRNSDEEGLILGGQLRGWLSQRLELSGAILLDNSIGSSTDVVIELGAQFFSGANVSFGGRIRADEDDEVLAGGIRFYFGASRR